MIVLYNESIMTKQILIVEDDPAILEMMAFSLSNAGFQVVKADHGKQALQQLQNQRPDLVVSDWGLPDFSGLELVTMIRRDDVLQDLPLIMLTARAEECDKIKGLEVNLSKRENDMKNFDELNNEVLIEEMETLKVVLEKTRKEPTPQQVEAAAKLIEAIRATAFNY